MSNVVLFYISGKPNVLINLNFPPATTKMVKLYVTIIFLDNPTSHKGIHFLSKMQKPMKRERKILFQILEDVVLCAKARLKQKW